MFNHVTVLLNEAVEGLNIKPDGIYVDCTLGGAGSFKFDFKTVNNRPFILF